MKRVPTDFEKNVFINCPFDDEYKKLFDAAVFTVQIAGFKPRCALETSNSGQPRLQKIKDIISACRFGIHDISRIELGPTQLPRFNMPLELGLDLGCSHWGTRHLSGKRLLIMDRDLQRHRQSLSDLEGHEIVPHMNDPKLLVCQVRDWLSKSVDDFLLPAGHIYNRYCLFQETLPRLYQEMRLDDQRLIFPDYLKLLRIWNEEERYDTGPPSEAWLSR